MKAAVRDSYGSSKVLKIEDVEKPTPGDNELLIKVYATTVNRTDWCNPYWKTIYHEAFHRCFQARFAHYWH